MDKSTTYIKKSRKRLDEKRDFKEMKLEQIHQKEEQKRARLNEIKKNIEDKINTLEKKFQDKDQITQNIKMAMEEYSSHKKDLKQIKKQDQLNNLRKHRRVQSAYKRILIDRLKEKEDRLKALNEKKQKIQEYK